MRYFRRPVLLFFLKFERNVLLRKKQFKFLYVSSRPGSADSGIADPAEISAEMRVLQEVMDTETVYVADLEEVIEVSDRPF